MKGDTWEEWGPVTCRAKWSVSERKKRNKTEKQQTEKPNRETKTSKSTDAFLETHQKQLPNEM